MSRAYGTPDHLARLLLRGSAALVVASFAFACIVQRGQRDPSVSAPNDFFGAGVFAATGVGAAIVNRKVTGDCYASCPSGYACNHDTGICERRTCMCPADQVCELVGGRVVCTQSRHRDEADLDASSEEASCGSGRALEDSPP
jgi:hypothetical protein